jgi:hypothetical protein
MKYGKIIRNKTAYILLLDRAGLFVIMDMA